MEIIRDISAATLDEPVVQTIGGFDGLHLGHQYLLQQVRQAALQRHAKTMVVTFSSHPSATLRPQAPVRLLTTLQEKLDLLSRQSIDYVAVLHFTPQMAAMSAQLFMERILKRQLHATALLMGYDHRFGHQADDTLASYQHYGAQLGIEVIRALEMPPLQGLHVSSSAIRQALTDGDIALANQLLGRPYSLTGTVTHGQGIGRSLGFPTANIQPADPLKLLPRHGAYAVSVTVPGDSAPHLGMLYIGNRPTFRALPEERIEVHLLDYHSDLYGQTLRIDFLRHLRGEQAFATPADLQRQLQADMQTIREEIHSYPPKGGGSVSG